MPHITDIYSPGQSPRVDPAAGPGPSNADPAIRLRTHSPANVPPGAHYAAGAADQHSTMHTLAFPPQHAGLALLPLEPSRGGGGNSSSGSDRGATPPHQPHPARAGHMPQGGGQLPPVWSANPGSAAQPGAMGEPAMLRPDDAPRAAAAGGRAPMMPMHDVAVQLSNQSTVLDPLLGALSANPMHPGAPGQTPPQLEVGQGGSAQHTSQRLSSGGQGSGQHMSGQLPAAQHGGGHPARGPPGVQPQASNQMEWRQGSGGRSRGTPGERPPFMPGVHSMPAAVGGQLHSHTSMQLAALVAEQEADLPLMGPNGGEGQMFDARDQERAFPGHIGDPRAHLAGAPGWPDAPPSAGAGAGSKFTSALAMAAGAMPRDGGPSGQSLDPALQSDTPRTPDRMHAAHASGPGMFDPSTEGHAGEGERRPVVRVGSGHQGRIGRTTSGTVVRAENIQRSDAKIANVNALTNARMGFFLNAGGGGGEEGPAAAEAGGTAGPAGGPDWPAWSGAQAGGRSRRSQKRRERQQRHGQRGSDAEYVVGDDEDYAASDDEDDDEWEGEREGEEGRRGGKRQRCSGPEGETAMGGSASGSEDPNTPAGAGKYGGKLSETERRERRCELRGGSAR